MTEIRHLENRHDVNFCRAGAMHKCGLCSHPVSVCLSVCVCVCVCLSVCLITFVNCVKTNKHIFNFFSPPDSQAIPVFQLQTAWQYSNGKPPNGGVECRWGRQKSRFWAYIWLNCLLLMLQQARCCQHGRRWTTATVAQVVTHRW